VTEEGQLHASSALPPRTEYLMCTEYGAKRAVDPVGNHWTRDKRFPPTGNQTPVPQFHIHCTAELFRLLRRVKANNYAIQKETLRLVSLCSYIGFGSTALSFLCNSTVNIRDDILQKVMKVNICY